MLAVIFEVLEAMLNLDNHRKINIPSQEGSCPDQVPLLQVLGPVQFSLLQVKTVIVPWARALVFLVPVKLSASVSFPQSTVGK